MKGNDYFLMAAYFDWSATVSVALI